MERPAYSNLKFADYLEFETSSDTRHELIEGVVYAMVGGTQRHNLIISRLHGELIQAVKPPCRVYSQGMKLKIGENCFYPDVFIACGEPDLSALYEAEASVIIEVASKSSQDYDLNEKLWFYRQLTKLVYYAVVPFDSEDCWVFVPTEDGVMSAYEKAVRNVKPEFFETLSYKKMPLEQLVEFLTR